MPILPAVRGLLAAVPALLAGVAALLVTAAVAAAITAPAVLGGTLALRGWRGLGGYRLRGWRGLMDRCGYGALFADAGLASARTPRRVADASPRWGGVADA